MVLFVTVLKFEHLYHPKAFEGTMKQNVSIPIVFIADLPPAKHHANDSISTHRLLEIVQGSQRTYRHALICRRLNRYQNFEDLNSHDAPERSRLPTIAAD